MILLTGRETGHVRHLFGAAHLALAIHGVIAGNTPARVWVDDPDAPGCALVWDGAHNLWLAGDAGDTRGWRELFDREIAPSGNGTLKAHVSREIAAAVFAGLPLHRRERVFYRGGRLAVADWRDRLPSGYRIIAIHDRYDDLAVLGNAGQVTAEIESGWHSVAAFRRHGFGFAAHDAGAVACWCTAEYASEGRCGIGIETVASHQRRGLATLTAAAFVEYCAERGITPHWDAWADNTASVTVAERVGFHKVATYPVFVGDFAALGT